MQMISQKYHQDTSARWRRSIMFFVLAMLPVLLGACGINSSTTGIFSSNPLSWYALHMFADHNGWAITSQGVLRTTDGGLHWKVVSPPDLASSSGSRTSYFLDAKNAWIVATSPTHYVQYGEKVQPENAHVYYTKDGGLNWQKSDLPDTANLYSDIRSGAGFVAGAFPWLNPAHSSNLHSSLNPLGENRRMISINQVFATNAHTVWVAVRSTNVHSGGGHEDYTHIYSRLWRSTDGGRSWEKAWEDTLNEASDYSASWITFAAPTTTALMQGQGQFALLITQNGRNFQEASLPVQDLSPLDRQMSALEPGMLFKQHDGIIALRRSELQKGQYRVMLYATHDSGQNWQKIGQLSVPSFSPAAIDPLVSYRDSTHWFISGRDVLLRTDDGGTRWQTFTLPKTLQFVGTLNFVSSQEGWGIGQTLVGNSSDPDRQTLTSSLVHTKDGGKTWEQVDAQMD